MCGFHESLWCNLTPRYKCFFCNSQWDITHFICINRLLLWWVETCIILHLLIFKCHLPFIRPLHVLWITLYIRQSSANSFIWLLIPSVMSFIYNKKRVGPKTEPCGTPEITLEGEKNEPFTMTCWERKDSNYFKNFPPYTSYWALDYNNSYSNRPLCFSQ